MGAIQLQLEEEIAVHLFEFIRYASRLGIAFFDLTDKEWRAERSLAETL